MTDDRIHRYLTDRAGTIELRPAGPAAITQRVARRRRVRRSLAVATAVATVGASAALIARPGDQPDDVVAYSATVTASPLDWSLVEPTSGLGYARAATALTDDGAVYSLSTAPGATDEGPYGDPATLYRSVDGAEWAPVDLPGDFWASSLTGAGGRLYAVGTSPLGGGSTYQVASTDDGGATWSTVGVPAAVAELQERYPDEVITAPPSIAVHDGTVVVNASVSAWLDVEARVPGGLASPDVGWEVTDDGVVLVSGECNVTAPPAAAGDPQLEQYEQEQYERGQLADALGRPLASTDCGPATDPTDPGEAQSFTWAELGVDGELLDLVQNGRNYVFVSHDGGEFAPVDPGVGASGGYVVPTGDGFTLFLTGQGGIEGTTAVMRSVDGTAWEPAGELPGYLMSAGPAGGRAAAAIGQTDGSVAVQVAQADGSWLAVDPLTALDQPDGAMSERVVFGPLGWAAVVWAGPAGGEAGGDADQGSVQVVHSVDGASLSVVPLAELLDVPENAGIDLSVTADAVAVRVTDPGDGDPSTVPAQRVVVGTPRG